MKNDNDLNKIKNAIEGDAPSDMDIHRWKVALRQRHSQTSQTKFSPWMQWVAAAAVGFIIGAVTFHKSNHQDQENFLTSDATVERVYTKL